MTEVKEKKVDEIRKEAEEGIRCPVKKALFYITEFLNGPMCGRCFPCEMGSYEMKIRLINIVEGNGKEEDMSQLKRISTHMLETSMCKKGKDTAGFILEWLNTGIFEEHLMGRCPERECLALIEYRIIPYKCIACGECKKVCRFNAIIGEERKPYFSGYLPFEIRDRRCIRCGECIKVCPVDAIEIIDIKEESPVGV